MVDACCVTEIHCWQRMDHQTEKDGKKAPDRLSVYLRLFLIKFSLLALVLPSIICRASFELSRRTVGDLP